jgi:hypothetical protein
VAFDSEFRENSIQPQVIAAAFVVWLAVRHSSMGFEVSSFELFNSE